MLYVLGLGSFQTLQSINESKTASYFSNTFIKIITNLAFGVHTFNYILHKNISLQKYV